MKRMTVGFPNLDAKLRLYKAWPLQIEQALAKAMNTEAEMMITKSKELTPVDTGALRASEHQTTKMEGTTVKTTLIAGGPAAPYALEVHENLEAYHTVGQAKFMETAVIESVNSGLDERLANAVEKAITKAQLGIG